MFAAKQTNHKGESNMTFGAFISTKRKEAKLNLRDTAKHLGIAYGYLCDIEQGRRPAPEGKFVERICSPTMLPRSSRNKQIKFPTIGNEKYRKPCWVSRNAMEKTPFLKE